MPSKSWRRKGKYSSQTKRKKGRLSRTPVASQPPAKTQPGVSTSRVSTVTPSTGEPASRGGPTAIRYRYVTTELRNIGILAGIILVILIIVASILR